MKIRSLIYGALFAAICAGEVLAQGAGQLGPGQMWANPTGSQGRGVPTNVSTYFDFVLGSTRGGIIERAASSWGIISPSSTSGLPLVSNGTGSDPAYQRLGIVGGGTNCASASGTCLDNITGFASTGLIERTGVGTYAFIGIPLSLGNGGTGGTSQATAAANVFPSPTRAGDVAYWNGSQWVTVPGNNSGTNCLQENSSGVASFGSCAGTSGVTSLNGQSGALLSYFPPGHRITLASGVPVMQSSQAGQTTVYVTPYQSDMMPIYNGTNIVLTQWPQVSQATTDTTKSPAAVTASSIYDIFCWVDTGPTNRCTRGPAWSSSSARGYTLTSQNGILLNTSSITNGPAALRGTWVGTIASNASSTVDYIFGASGSGGVAASLEVWNAYNRVTTCTTVTDTGAGYNGYISATPRQARASVGNQVGFLLGSQEDAVQFAYASRSSTVAATSAATNIGVGFDVTNAFSFSASAVQTSAASSVTGGNTNAGSWNAPIGTHILAALEASDGTNSNNFDVSSNNSLSGCVRN